jgi:hypothetical protein
VAGHHGEQLLLAVGAVLIVVCLVVLLDHEVAGVPGHAVDTERLDVEMARDEMNAPFRDVRALGIDSEVVGQARQRLFASGGPRRALSLN